MCQAGINLGLPFQPERTCSPEQNQALGLNDCDGPVTPAGGEAPYVEACRACEAQYSCVLEATVRTPVTGRDYSFDDYLNALVTTIQMYTLAGWGDIMQDMMDADNPAQVGASKYLRLRVVLLRLRVMTQRRSVSASI